MIKPEDRDRILEACRIEEVVGDFVSLTRRGTSYVGLCPFHAEKTPSFHVTPSKNICKCFGCGEGGDSASFIMKHEHYSYPEALRYLAKKYGIEIKEEEQTPEEIRNYNEREKQFSVNNYAKNYFIEQLFQTEEGQNIALPYFKQRGYDKKTIEKFQLGYCPKSKDSFTQEALRNGYNIDTLKDAGLSIIKGDNDYIDKFRERVIFPIQNISGRTIAFGGRIMSSGQNEKTAKYINSPETLIYHKSDVLYGIFLAKSAISKQDKCYLVEGYADVISMHQLGIENVVASSGTSLTSGQIKLIKRFTNNITIIYDGDNAGIKAALKGVSLILQEDMNVRVVLLPEKEDPDSFAQAHTLEETQDYIDKHEQSFIEFKIQLLLQNAGNDLGKRADAISNIAADIALIKDRLKRALFIKQCSTLLNISEEDLASSVQKSYQKIFYQQKGNFSTSETAQNTEIEIISPQKKHPKELLPLKSDSILDIAERELLKLLINKGCSIINLPQEDDNEEYTPIFERLDNYIFQDLYQLDDELTLNNHGINNPLYRKLFDMYANYAEKYNTNPIEMILKNEAEQHEICDLIIELTNIETFSEKESNNYIKGNQQNNETIKTIDNDPSKLHEHAIRILQRIRLFWVQKCRNTFIDKLNNPNLSEEEIDKIFKKIEELNSLNLKMENILGTSYRE